MPTTDYDYFIVGQGLAGSLLAFKLIKQGLKVLVIDNQHHHSSSLVAAGIINPITGHRLNITDHFSQFHKPAIDTYLELEKLFQSTLYQSITQQRLIKNAGQFSYWQQRQQQTEYQAYLGQHAVSHSNFKQTEFGIAEIKQSGYVDVTNLLTKVKQWLIGQHAYQAIKLDYQQIKSSDSAITINGQRAKKLVFCEGHQAIHNPWLAQLPFKLAKGEILTLALTQNSPKPTLNAMLNWGQWLLPVSNTSTHSIEQRQYARLGSTFAWDDLTEQYNTASKQKLLDSFSQYTTWQGEVIAHQTGIRPTTIQRKPFVGAISSLKNAYCFNGFGSKGCLLIPHYADLLIAHCQNQAPLPAEVTQYL